MLLILTIIISVEFSLAVTKEQAQLAITSSEDVINEIEDASFPVNAYYDILSLAKKAYERAEFAELIRNNASDDLSLKAISALEGLNYEGFSYQDVVLYTDQIMNRKQQTYDIHDELISLELTINSNSKIDGIDTTYASKLWSEANNRFYEEKYSEAEQLLAQAYDDIDAQRAALSQMSVIERARDDFIKKYGMVSSIIIGVILIVGLVYWRIEHHRYLKKKLISLFTEKKTLNTMFEKTQIDRFKKGKLSRKLYELRMEKYHKRLSAVQNEISILESRLGKEKKQGTYLIMGRFQPIHNGHLHLIKKLTDECEELIIAVLVHSGSREINPLTYSERKDMIDAVMKSENILNYSVYPFPEQSSYTDYADYVNRMLPRFDLIVTADENMKKTFAMSGFKVRKEKKYQDLDSVGIRKELCQGIINPKHLPKGTTNYLTEINYKERCHMRKSQS